MLQVKRCFAGFFVMAWLLLPIALLGQGAPGSIQGVVCEIGTCKPLNGVQVSLVPSGSEAPVKTLQTDVSGEFLFLDVPAGTYMVRARADNFMTRGGAPSAVIANGERIDNIKVELTPHISTRPKTLNFRIAHQGFVRPIPGDSTADERRDASSSKRLRHHQGELFLPERIAVRPGTLLHDNVRTCIAQRVRPPSSVLEEERL